MIHKKIGKFPLVALLMGQSIYSVAAPHISLTLFDDHNRTCREAEVGSHYRLEARIQGVPIKGWPQVAGLPADVITGRQQRQEVSWTNGKKTESTCFTWDIMFNTPGATTLGPVSCLDDTGKTITSTSLPIMIHEQAAHTTTATKTASPTSTFIRWEIDRLDPFVGEIVPVRLVFYTTDNTVQLENISEIKLEGAHLEFTREPVWASALHNGISYKTATWTGILSAQNAGVVSMPLVTISYRVDSPHTHSHSPWAMMHRMFNAFSQLYHKRSATLSLHIRALPPTQHSVIGVGIIHAVTRNCSDVSMRCGEASTMTYRLEGSIHPNCLQLPVPETIEQSTKIYSSAYTHRGTYPAYHYEHEYVIHPQEAGRISCTEHVLWYFNPEKETYESCTIPAFAIDVQASEKVTPVTTTESTNTESEIIHDHKKEPAFIGAPISLQPILPFTLFLLLLLLPCLCAIGKNWLRRQCSRWYYMLKLRWIRRIALRKIPRAVRDNNGYMILHIMRHVMHTTHNIPQSASEGDFIAQSLRERGVEPQQIQDWHALWSDMQKAAFGSLLSPEEYASLHTRCRKWISIL